MRFYDQQHEFYCGVDLHTRKMYLCVLDREGNKRLHRNLQAKPQDFLKAIKPFRVTSKPKANGLLCAVFVCDQIIRRLDILWLLSSTR
jgi:hypothetical protein